MNLPQSHNSFNGSMQSQRGMATVVVLAFISILLIYILANVRTLNHLGHELKLLDRKQTLRLETVQLSIGSGARSTTNQNTTAKTRPTQ
jgi:hypothetical protein